MTDTCYCGRAKEGSHYVIEPFSGDQRQMGYEISRVHLIGKAIHFFGSLIHLDIVS